MWISRKVVNTMMTLNGELRVALVEATASRSVLAQQNSVLQTQLDFMRMRLNQLEVERAQLLHRATGIQVPVPEIVPSRMPPHSVEDIMNGTVSFEDMGDDEARKTGVMNDPETGEVIYAPRADDKGEN